ncbi:ferric-dicitrate binding protein FerR (iron transport regulator) [Flavobacterium sp. CG_9.1]|uniref:FecR family protein n=1 Tax=Flavobacterium sp. CG_9.1 TaxID=2787728 RepID=UPI0018CAD582|nr:FecR domain-containing protein [Flavobacterium sp. CG_9.1]MBG6062249.1 ferric-dicitrate binding protein FerR (iron transport regulator) [Flavobacterium sp. CG_9.1]
MKKEKEILKWLNNDLSSKEMEDLKQSEDLQTLEKIAHYASQLEAPKVDAKAALETLKSRNHSKSKPKVRTINFKIFYRVAAVLVLAITSGYFFFYSNNTSFETQIAQRKIFTLPDNSEVVLNASSKISFNEKKWANKRTLTLEGEAFFKVKKGQTFSVKTTDGIVTVLGTQFNVKERKNYFEVHCYEGLVSVTHNNKTTKLPPGKTLRVMNGKVENVEDFYAINPSWIQQESSFNKIPLDQVIAELERQYDLKIKVDGIDTSKLFTGSFTHTDKEIALQAVTIPLKLSYKIEGKTIIFYNYGAQ